MQSASRRESLWPKFRGGPFLGRFLNKNGASGESRESPDMVNRKKRPAQVVGWRESLALPDLSVPIIRAKLDSGARTSALHAFDLEEHEGPAGSELSFSIHPHQRSGKGAVRVRAPLHDRRRIRSSSGHDEYRPVILTRVVMGDLCWSIELTLTNRDAMGFRMLLGRQAMRGRLLIDTGRSFLAGPPQLPLDVDKP
jgi:hypothetical protein